MVMYSLGVGMSVGLGVLVVTGLDVGMGVGACQVVVEPGDDETGLHAFKAIRTVATRVKNAFLIFMLFLWFGWMPGVYHSPL